MLPQNASAPALPLVGQGIKLSRLEAALPGDLVHAGVGDWLLETKHLRLTIGGDSGDVTRRLRHGSIIEAFVGTARADEALDVRPVLEIGGRLVALRVEGLEALNIDGKPRLRLRQSSRDGALVLETDISLRSGEAIVDLETRVLNVGERRVRMVRVGDRTRWPGAPVFVPRLGFVKFTSRTQAPWLARTGGDLTFVLAFPEGPAEVSFAFDRVGPTEQRAMAAAVDLDASEQKTYRRTLIFSAKGLPDVAATAWQMLGYQLGRISGKLDPPPSWASVQVTRGDGKPMLVTTPKADGSFDVAVPPGDYELLLESPGGKDREPITVVAESTTEARLLPPEPGRLRASVTDEAGRPLAARWTVRGIRSTPNPSFGPTESSAGAGNVFYTRRGEGLVELPPGHYEVITTRGIEYELAKEQVHVTAESGASVRAVLERTMDTSGWLGCDFHLHAAPSPDSTVTLEDRVASLLAEGVEFAVATDHNHVTDYGPTIERLEAHAALASIPGVEITTVGWGHFIAFPFPTTGPLPPHDAEPAEIFATTRQLSPGAVIQVNHPHMRGIGYFNRGEIDRATGAAAGEGFSFDFDTLEVVNGFELAQQDVIRDNIAAWFALLNAGRRITGVGNSDSHRLVQQWAGYPRTYVRVPDDDPGNADPVLIAEALRAGHATISAGLFVNARIDGSAGPGDLISAQGGEVSLETIVRAPAWIDARSVEVYVNGELAHRNARARAVLPGNRLEWVTRLKIERDSWVVVVAKGEKSLEPVIPGKIIPFGLTNPIYVDADGDGMFQALYQTPAGDPVAGGP